MLRTKAKIITLPTITKIDTLTKWVNKNRFKYLDKRKFPAKLIIINLEKIKYIRPYHIAPLACMVHEYQTKGYKVRFIGIAKNKGQNFEIFNLEQFDGKVKEAIEFPISKSKNVLPLWRICEGAHNIYPQHAQNYFEKNHFSGLDLFALSNSLGELMNNIFDHSDSSIPGFTFTEFNENKRRIITSVCDFLYRDQAS